MEKFRVNLTNDTMLLLLQALLLKYPIEQIVRIFLLLDSATNWKFMDTIKLFLNYVQQTNPDNTESHIKQSIEKIAMQEGIVAPMKSFEEYWFLKFYNKEKEKVRDEGKADQINDVTTLSSLVVAEAKANSSDDIQSLIERSLKRALSALSERAESFLLSKIQYSCPVRTYYVGTTLIRRSVSTYIHEETLFIQEGRQRLGTRKGPTAFRRSFS